jgi:hypothetical protein
MGRPVVPRLVERLEKGNPSRQLRILRVFRRMGPVAKAARAHVQRLASSPIPDLAAAAQQALDAIGK